MPSPPETDVARIHRYCRARVPARLRHHVRVEAAVRGSSVTIFDCRPPWHPNLTEWSKVRVAQLRYSANTHHWSLYWADRNGRWHRYDDLDPGPVDKALDEIADKQGQRRLDNPQDFVRLEIEAALKRNVRVIPILVEGVEMPSKDRLPDRLAGLARRQALFLSANRFGSDTARLLRELDKTLAVAPRAAAGPTTPTVRGARTAGNAMSGVTQQSPGPAGDDRARAAQLFAEAEASARLLDPHPKLVAQAPWPASRAMTIRSVSEITDDYEAWMRERLPFVLEAHLKYKHQLMAGKRDREAAFRFLRATFYLWACRFRERLPQLVDDAVPRVLGVGDIHLGNFGTWRDAEGHLVWGVYDVDEAAALPCTNDLVRLVTSARLADLDVHGADAASDVLSGYRERLATGARPFVLAEQEKHLWKLARDQPADPQRWWQALRRPDPLPAHSPLGNVEELLRGAFPDADLDILALGTRLAGLGSLGRPRVVAVARWHGSLVCREAKAVLPSAWDWAGGVRDAESHAEELLSSPTRTPDPYTKVIGGWSIRRLAPDSGGIDIKKLYRVDDQRALLRSMGGELANIHLTKADPAVLLGYVQHDPRWLADASQIMATAVRGDRAEYAAR